jgi:hypothetical protein
VPSADNFLSVEHHIAFSIAGPLDELTESEGGLYAQTGVVYRKKR